MMKNNANFAELEQVEIDGAAALYDWCDLGRVVASNSGLIVLHGAYDIKTALATLPPISGMPSSVRAKLVARHAERAGSHLHAAQLALAKLPRAFAKHYAELLNPQRRRRAFDLGGK
jgi:hypothetical protein